MELNSTQEFDKLISTAYKIVEIKRYKIALDKFHEAIKLFPERTESYNGASKCFFELKDYKKAIEYGKKAISIDPLNAYSFYIVGLSFRRKHLFDKAKFNLNKAIELKPHISEFWIALGELYLFKKQYKEAHKKLKKALELNPNCPKSMSLKAWVFFEQNELEQALPLINKALSIEPENSSFHLIAGQIFGKTKAKTIAENHFKTAINLSPNIEEYRALSVKSTIENDYWWGDAYEKIPIESSVHYLAFYFMIVFGLLMFIALNWLLQNVFSDESAVLIYLVILIFTPFIAIFFAVPTFMKIWEGYKKWGVHGITLNASMFHLVFLEILLGILFYGIAYQKFYLIYVAIAGAIGGAGLTMLPNIIKDWMPILYVTLLLLSPIGIITFLIIGKSISLLWLVPIAAYTMIIIIIVMQTNGWFKHKPL